MIMSEIICPGCGESIPDDSKYCDQCGAELLECVGCGALGTGQFCGKCGKPMVARKTDRTVGAQRPVAAPITGADTSAKSQPGDGADLHSTCAGRRKSIVLQARKGNFVIEPEDGAVIGRGDGPYCDRLGACNLISRRHGKFVRRGRGWMIMDFGSTNGTLVNDVELSPDEPVPFSVGDVIDIGTYIFDVVER